MNLLRLFVVSLFAATEALVLPGASSRLVTKPQLKLQVQMSEPDTITSEEKTSSAKTFDAEEKTSSSSTLPANYDVELASKLLIEALGLSYADKRGTYGGRINEPKYKQAVDGFGKKQLVLSVDPEAAAATVVFRGTDTSNPNDIIRDVQYLTTSAKCFDDVRPSFSGSDEFGALDGTGPLDSLKSAVSAPFGAQVHRGFARRAIRYSRWVQAELRKEAAFEPASDTDPWDHGGIASLKTLYVTGHSLGGAASLTFAYWVKVAFKDLNPDLVVHVYTFSAPNVGNAAWAKQYDEWLGETTFQHNYGPDVVPLFPPWLWKVGHVLSIEHKNHGPGVLGALKLGGQATAQPKESRIEGDNSMSVSVPLDYHTGITRVFVPYFEHAKPGAAESAWKKMSRLKVLLDIAEGNITETTFSNSQAGQQLKPAGLLGVVCGDELTVDKSLRAPHFIMDDITATWSFPSRAPATKLKNGALTALNLILSLSIFVGAVGPILSKTPEILDELISGAALLLSVAAPPFVQIFLTPVVAVLINLAIGRIQA